MSLVDSHCHLHLMKLNNEETIDQVIERALAKDVTHILNVCVRLADWSTILSLTERYNRISVSIGIHPNEQQDTNLDTLLDLARHQKVVGVGETGLDYFRSTGDLTWQKERFIHHIEVAKTVGKPLIIHMRDASDDTMQVLNETKASTIGGVMHCFNADWETAKKALDLNFYISFSGVVTFKNAQNLQSVAKKIPLDRILIETDTPYLAPVPHRGKPNEPSFLWHTAAFIAHLRDVPMESFGEQTTENFFRLFNGAQPTYV